jgi:4-oxalocrotonate tautomerase
MPVITIKVFEGELTGGQAAELIDDVTEAVIPFVGEAVRSNVWVLVEEVKSGSWGIGGKAFGLPDLRRIQQSAPPDQQPYSRRAMKKNTKADRIG